MRVLITGVTGFAGTHLAAEFSARTSAELFGIHRPGSKRPWPVALKKRIKLYPCDLRNEASVRAVVKKTRPDRVFHLAAQASVPVSWRSPHETFRHNVIGTLNLLEALRAQKLSPRILITGSAEQYGLAAPDSHKRPLTEESPFKPLTPYAVSKIAQEFLAYQYFLFFGMPVIRTRAFNHTGPGQSSQFVAGALARQVALIEAGLQKPELFVGNLESIRDFTDVRDVARAYRLLLDRGTPGDVYNICTGIGRSVREVLEGYRRICRVPIRVRREARRVRSVEIPCLVGSPAKIRRAVGWKPAIPFERTLEDLLNDWRQSVKNSVR